MEHLQGLRTPLVDVRNFRARFYNCDLAGDTANLEHGFHDFPDFARWEIDEKTGKLTPKTPDGDPLANPATQADRQTRFVQHWLFFELLREVFKEDLTFDYKHFITSDKWITTARLQEYLTRWQSREQDEKWASGQTRRMIRIHQALETARINMSQYCAVNITPNLGRIDDPIWPIDKAVANSIMVLGEALMRSLIRIQNDPIVKFNLVGWTKRQNDGQGWGYSQIALERFKKPQWCPKTVRMLEKLMRGNTVGLILALSHPLDEGYHTSCTETVCRSQNTKELYEAIQQLQQLGPSETAAQTALIYNASRATVFPTAVRHSESCRREAFKCQLIGLDENKLIRILKDGHIPLFHYDADSRKVEVESMQSFKQQDYTVFSHVWADGYGNHDANEMRSCTLKELSDLCNAANQRDPQGTVVSGQLTKVRGLFWIDTLALPVKDKYRDQRNDAIGQIHNVYRYATHTIVLDKGLMEDRATNYAGTAMRLTMCRWMTRLWTLQEAVLSDVLLFDFSDNLLSLDQIENQLGKEDEDFHKCISEAARTYYQGILGEERRKARDKNLGEGGPGLIASVWRAVQWRGATFRHHETLALAILLGGPVGEFASLSSMEEPSQEKRDEHMKNLIQHLADRDPCAIPAGMIFLPGEKLSTPGFRWAPRSWLTAEAVLSPDPLDLHQYQKKTALSPKGLQVTYPGFKLHIAAEQLDSLFNADCFHFPVNWELDDWYLVQWPKEHEQFRNKAAVGKRQLAIITMRYPISQKEQSGLLVAIKKIVGNGLLEVDIISRIFLSRERKHSSVQDCKKRFRAHNPETIPCGELLEKRQWCVDGPQLPSQKIEDTQLQQQNPPLVQLESEQDETARGLPDEPEPQSGKGILRSLTTRFSQSKKHEENVGKEKAEKKKKARSWTTLF